MNNKIIFNYLEELFPNPKSELNYNKDYELLISVMLSAQTTDKRVNEVTSILFNKYSSLELLRNASVNDIESIIKPLGTYKKKAFNVIEIANKLKETNDMVPNDRNFLESLNGVGRKTTNVVLGILYNVPCIAVDTHVARVSKRLGFANKNDSVLEIENKLYKIISSDNMIKTHHQLLLFGRYHCKAVKPLCDNCKLSKICKEKRN
ncbi:MAG TPA: endonuclease III [Bacilli bacterium]|nr:endonuclease III [Bacilli bacterium]